MRNLRNNYCLSGRLFEVAGKATLAIDEFFRFSSEKKCESVELRHSQINPCSSDYEINRINDLSETFSLPVELITMRKGKLNEKKDLKLFLEYLELAKKLKCRQIKVGGTDFKLLREAAELAEEAGITLGTNNHLGTMLETKQGTMDYFKQIAHPNFKLLLDPSHLWLNNDPVDFDFIKTMQDRISFLIIQDYQETVERGYQEFGTKKVRPATEHEQGGVGYPEIIRILEMLNCNVPVGLVQPSALYYLNHMKGAR